MLLASVAQAAVYDLEENDVPVTNRFGHGMLTEIYRFNDSNQYPVIFQRTQYGRQDRDNASNYTAQGFIYVSQNVSGSELGTTGNPGTNFYDFGSFQSESNFVAETYDAIEWIVQQPWCNGRVGMTGGSGNGIGASMALWCGHTNLVAVDIDHSVANFQHYWYFRNGVKRQMFTYSNHRGIRYTDFEWPRPDTHNFSKQTWIDFIRAQAVSNKVAYFESSGLYDIFNEAAFDNFSVLASNGYAHVMMGAKDHTGIVSYREANATNKYPLVVAPAYNVEFMDYMLGNVTEGQDASMLKYYLMGDPRDVNSPGNIWKTTDHWPVENTPFKFYFKENGVLSGYAPPEGSQSLSYVYNPTNPVFIPGGNVLPLAGSATSGGPMDQRSYSNRNDVLRFVSEPLTHPVEIVGNLDATLYISTDVPDTMFVAVLVDYAPDGYQALISESAIMARYWSGEESPSPLTTGTVYRLDMDMWSTAAIIDAGHRIGVHITSSSAEHVGVDENMNRYEIHPNTYDPVNSYAEAQIANQTLHLSADYPSHIILPVVLEADDYETLLFDFGSGAQITTGNWNNVTNATIGVQIAGALNDTGGLSRISLEITDAFNAVDTSGTLASNLYAQTAQRDSHSVTSTDSAEIKLSGLNPARPCTLTFFGSSASSGEVAFSADGQRVALNNADNTNLTASLSNIYPDTNGCVTVSITTTNGAAAGFLGVLELTRPIEAVPGLSIEVSGNDLSVPEGGTNTFDVRLSLAPVANQTVSVSRISGDTNITVQAGTSLVFTPANGLDWQTVTLAASQDDDWLNDESLFQCFAAGMSSKNITATEVDDEMDPAYLLPWSESFEALSLGALDGQHDWSAGAGAVVTNSDAQGGSQSLLLSGVTASHTFVGNVSNMWATLWARPVTGPKAAQIPSDASAVFYVNTNDLLVAYDSTNATVVPTATVSNGWNKFALECDYVSKVWNLELNDELVVSNFAFYGAPAAFQALELIEASAGASYVDEISITDISPAALPDTDGDGIPDSWEMLYYGGATNANPNATASNGVNTVLQAYIAGLDPTDPDALFEMSGLQNNVLFWSGVSGRVYTVYWTSNLLSGFQTLEANVPWTGSVFTDSTHSAEQKGFYKIEVKVE
jgi:predicted acyl esterase